MEESVFYHHSPKSIDFLFVCFFAVHGPLTAVASPVAEHRFRTRRLSSASMAHGPSCSVACGIFRYQGTNPCPLHRQADSQPLRHQGSPELAILELGIDKEDEIFTVDQSWID